MRAPLLLAVLLAGCGGGGGADSDVTPPPPPPPPVTQAALTGGVFASSSLTSGVVSVFDYAGGAKGVQLATSLITSLGGFSVSVPATSGLVLIEASGCYTEKAIPWGATSNGVPTVSNAITANVCTASPALSAAVVVSSTATTQIVAVTPYTHAAVGLASFLVRNGSTPTAAQASANVALSSWVGTDILTTQPVAPSRSMLMSGPTLYGSLLAGLSSWVNNYAAVSPAVIGASGLTTLDLAAAMQSDLAQDGLLNGTGRDSNGLPVALTVGGAALSTTAYRHQFAVSATIRLRAETEGAVGATAAEQARVVGFLPSLVAYNDAVNTLTDASAVVALDEGGPVVIIGSPLPGASLTGNSGMAGFARDIVGIPTGGTTLLIDGALYTPFVNQYIPNNFINTTIFSKTAHILAIRAVNNLGTVSSANVTVNFI